VQGRHLSPVRPAGAQERGSGRGGFLQGEEERDALDGVVAAVDIVAEEEVVCVGDLSPDLKQLHQVVELPVDVAADRHGRRDLSAHPSAGGVGGVGSGRQAASRTSRAHLDDVALLR
jgi:hypothetical protein